MSCVLPNFICSKCKHAKNENAFYKNSKKKNGLESNCKECVCTRKMKRYKQLSVIKKKTKYLRRCKQVKVIEVSDCTLEEHWIIRPTQDKFCFEKELIGIMLWHNY